MDFMKWLNSLDELLYEVMSWLVFFPVTLWRAVRHPLATMAYADRQLDLPESEQYSDAVSPPLFLTLALLIGHLAAAALGEEDAIVANHHGLAGLVSDDTSALLFRLLLFSLFPMLVSTCALLKLGTPVRRETLRLPFYAQCYPTAVFALGLSLGGALARAGNHRADVAGVALISAAICYYLAVETLWFRHSLGMSGIKAFGLACFTLIAGFIVIVALGFLFRG